MEIPCNNCICFALCNSKVKYFEGLYKTRFILLELEKQCSLINDWLWVLRHERSSMYQEHDPERIKAFCKFFKIKHDNHPDYNLLRHLPKEEESCLSQWMKKETHQ